MEAAGLAIGVVSLVIAFDHAFKVFNFFSAMVDVPKDCQRCKLQLVIEYNRFLAWGEFVGLINVNSNEDIASCLGTNAQELCNVVLRIGCLLEEFKGISIRWQPEMQPSLDNMPRGSNDVSTVSSLASKYQSNRENFRRSIGMGRMLKWMSRQAHHAIDVAAHPARARWVLRDRTAFEQLLKELHILTMRIHELMRGHQESRLLDITAQTYRELVVARNDLTELKDMLEAVTTLVLEIQPITGPGALQQSGQMEELQDILRLKHLERRCTAVIEGPDQLDQLAVEAYLRDVISVPRHDMTSLREHFTSYASDDDSTEGYERHERGTLCVRDGREEVWIAWKQFGEPSESNVHRLESTVRIATLAQMLSSRNTSQLFTPECAGYIDDPSGHRTGWIFQMPRGSQASTTLMDLHTLMAQGRAKPSLRQRRLLAWKLCSSLMCLHAADWIHKAIHSGNILFPCDGDKVAIDAFTLSGFEYSRPQSGRTTGSCADPRWNIYRWPRVQNQQPDDINSRKSYDIYSMGLVLLEIAHWKPLPELMGLKRWPQPSSQDARIRGWLLSELPLPPFGASNPLEALQDVAGDVYWGATRRCLVAHGAEGMDVEEEEDQSRNSTISMRLQANFTELVVGELKTSMI